MVYVWFPLGVYMVLKHSRMCQKEISIERIFEHFVDWL